MKEIYVLEVEEDIIWVFSDKKLAEKRLKMLVKHHPKIQLFTYYKADLKSNNKNLNQ